MKSRITMKNIVMTLLLVIITIVLVVTIGFASKGLTENTNIQNNEMPEMGTEMSSGTEEPPELPDGEQGETPPDIPSGETPNEPPEMNGTNTTSSNELDISYYIIFSTCGLIISIITIYIIMSNFNKKIVKETFYNGDKIIIFILITIILTTGITYGSSLIAKNISRSNQPEETNPNGNNTTNITYSSQTEITSNESITSGNYSSNNIDQNAILVSGDIDVSIDNIAVEKTGDSSGGDNTSFYGINSAIIAKDGANLVLKNIEVTTNAVGANGVFSYGGSATTNNSSTDGTTVTISDSTIKTTKDNSGGIMTTGGGTLIANNLNIETSGTSSAAIRTDRGGGNVTVEGGSYLTTGQGSPTIYSTANVKVANAFLTATSSEGIVIEGKNSVEIDNVTLVDTNNLLNGQSTTYKNIFLYQSMSGDAADGVSSFTAKNSDITTNKGDTFYVTNTSATITLENNTIKNNDQTGNFLRIQKDSWGNTGSNGGIVLLTMTNQIATGNIVVDSISTLDMVLNDSSYEGAINEDNSAKEISLTIDSTSKIKLTKDSYVTFLNNEDITNSNIDFNGYKLYVNGVSIN